ncbi:TspO/MBR family protein [Streptomyces sp. NPDC005047]
MSSWSHSHRGAAGGARAGLPMLLVLLGACYTVAAIGAVAAGDAGSTYQALDRPVWAPPAWLFGPVWTVLYATVAVAAWLFLRQPSARTRPAMTWWTLQLVFNLVWTPLFFAAGEYGLAFADICLLLVALAATLMTFGRKRRTAALVLLPYTAWVTYAAALNLDLWLNNP